MILLFLNVVFAAEPEDGKAESEITQTGTPTLKNFYVAPTLGFSIGLFGLSSEVNINADFLVKNTNIYLGFDTGFSYLVTTYDGFHDSGIIMSVPFRANIVFGFPSENHPNVKFTALRLSAGINFIFDKGEYFEGLYLMAFYAKPLDNYIFYINPDIKLAVDFVFKYDLLLEIGVEYFAPYVSDFAIAVGYRF